jgi:hypothetical protein
MMVLAIIAAPVTALPHDHEFWASGSLRCVLVAEKTADYSIVQVLDNGTPVASLRCESDEHAIELAERLRKLLLDPTPPPHNLH